jgi:hypothetical protein
MSKSLWRTYVNDPNRGSLKYDEWRAQWRRDNPESANPPAKSTPLAQETEAPSLQGSAPSAADIMVAARVLATHRRLTGDPQPETVPTREAP